MRIGILGGTFDPIHKGHLYAAQKAKAAFRLSQVWLMPAAQSPFKTEKKTASFAHRLTMARLCAAALTGFSVCAFEGITGGVSYTVETLRQLTRLHPQDEFFFIMGADAYAGFSRWREPDEIRRLVQLIVVTRPGYRFPEEAPDARVHFLPLPGIKLSSEELRKALAEGADCTHSLPPEVLAYIRAENLYSTKQQKEETIRCD